VAEQIERDNLARIDREPGIENFIARVPEIAVRLATILAAGRQVGANEHTTVSLPDLEWGIAVAQLSADRMVQDAAHRMVEDITSHGQRVNKVIDTIKKHKRIDHSDLLRKVQKSMNGKDLRGILDDLIASGTIRKEEVRHPTGGPIGVRYSMA
jgi:hypothetical protein